MRMRSGGRVVAVVVAAVVVAVVDVVERRSIGSDRNGTVDRYQIR